MNWLINLFKLKTIDYEIASPKKRLSEKDLMYEETDTETLLHVKLPKGSYIVNLPNTNSMEPLLDANMSVICASPPPVEDLQVGDIVGYWLPQPIGTFRGAFHSIIEIGHDQYGWFCKTKGLNPKIKDIDPVLVRYEYIVQLCRGVIW